MLDPEDYYKCDHESGELWDEIEEVPSNKNVE
jgi:hypothetical protein